MTVPRQLYPEEIAAARAVACVRTEASQIEPRADRDRATRIALRAAIELCAPIHRPILRDMLAHDMASHGNPDVLDDLANSMTENARAWADEAEGGAKYLRDPLNRGTGE